MDFSDKADLVILRFDDGSQAKHSRKKLSNLCEYFRILLNGNFSEKEKNEINLQNVDGEILSKLLQLDSNNDFDSINSLIPSLNEAWKLIETADMLTLNYDVIDKYVTMNFITNNNCEEIVLNGHAYNRYNIVAAALRFLCINRLQKPIEMYEDFNQIKNTKIFKQNSSYDSNTEIESILNQYQLKHDFYIIGGYNFKTQTQCYKIDANRITSSNLDTNNNEIKQNFSNFTPIPSFPDDKIEDYRIVSIDCDIFVTGGFDYESNIATTAVWRYRATDDKWDKVSPMKHARSFHCAVAVQNQLYVCGGYNGYKVHSSLEHYNAKLNKWISQPKMLMGVGHAACASHSHNLYVVCGQCGVKSIQTTNQIQRFDTLTRQWSYITQYKSPVFHPYSEYGLNCQFVDDVMYIFGGQTVRVDCYDLNSSEWKRLSDTNERRCDSTSLTFRGQLILAGGIDFYDGSYHDTVEIYDKTENNWQIVECKLPKALKNLGLCYIFNVERKTFKES